MADFALWPFGRQLVKRTDSGVASTVGNIIRIVVADLAHTATAVALAVTIIGIPLALANLTLVPVSLVPSGE